MTADQREEIRQSRRDFAAAHRCLCGGPVRYYDIGFDDGYQCQHCKRIFETHESDKLIPEEPKP
jgi:hypothetical protein